MKKKAILVFKSCGLGDFIMAIPALKSLSHKYPDHLLVFCTYTTSDNLLKGNYSYAKNNEHSMAPWVHLAQPGIIDDCISINNVKNIYELLGFKRYLRQYDFDFSFVMAEWPRPSISVVKKILLTALLSFRIPEHSVTNLLLRRGSAAHLRGSNLLPHHVEQNFLSVLGEVDQIKPSLPIDFDLHIDDVCSIWAELWVSENIGNGRFICIAPGSIQPHKKWTETNFIELIESILSKHSDVNILVLGTKQDIKIGENLVSIDSNRVFSLAGSSSIMQSAAILKISGHLIANDGGAGHLGDAVGCKVVSLIPGIEYPVSIEPWNNFAYSIRQDVSCAPCYSFLKCPLGHNDCMLNIAVKRVLDVVEKAFFDLSGSAIIYKG